MNIQLSKLSGLVYLKDSHSRIIDCNAAFAAQLGYRETENLTGKNFCEFAWNSQAAERILETDRLVLTNSNEHTEEEVLKHLNGKYIHLYTSKKPLFDDLDNLIGILCICHDITSIRAEQIEANIERDKAKTANRAKSSFLACMSHDLRTPLNAINGMAQILRRQHLTEAYKDLVNDILSSCQVLKSLIEDILNLSKIESNQLEFAEEPVDLRSLAQKVIAQLSFLAKEKNVALLLTYDEQVPRFVMGDSRRIRQVLMNLIGNAIKFTHDGQIILAIEPIHITVDSAELQIAVEDTGIGIPKEKVGRVFEKFFQVETKQKHEGTGLGLSIVEHLVNKMGGELEVNSQSGKGATFWCSLKLNRQTDSLQRAEWEHVAKHFMVLIIDNDMNRAEQIKQFIRTDNIICSDQTEALSLSQGQKKPFFIIMIHESILSQDKKFIEALLKNQNNLKPKFLIYGESITKKLYQNELIDEFLTIPAHQDELIGTLISIYTKVKNENILENKIIFRKNLTPKILLVEDNPINQKVIKIMLNNHGCDIQIASNGKQALNLSTNDFDLIFMDLGLPDASGLDITKSILADKNFNQKTPIVALTGHVSEQDRQDCYKAGMSDFITKPINEADLVQVLVKYLT